MSWWWIIGLIGPFGLVALVRVSADAYRAWSAKRKGPDLVFSSRQRVEAVEPVMADLFQKVFGFNYYDCYISDESSLSDFEPEYPAESTAQKIHTEFGIDTSTLPDQRLVTICEAIAGR